MATHKVINLRLLLQAGAGGLLLVALLGAANPPAAPDGESGTSRTRETIANLPSQDQDRLETKLRRFLDMHQEERERLQRLYAAIEKEPDAAALKAALDGYNEWLESLSTVQRLDLLRKPASERLIEINQVLKEQRRDRTRYLPREDAHILRKWVQEFFKKHEKEFLPLARISQSPPRDSNGRRPPQFVEHFMRSKPWMIAFREDQDRWRFGEKIGDISVSEFPLVQREDLRQLEQRLSESSRKQLQGMPNDREKRDTIVRWLVTIAWDEGSRSRYPNKRSRPQIENQVLEEYFAEELQLEDRSRLLALPLEEMERELRKLYVQDHLISPDPDFERRGPGRHGRRRGEPPFGHRHGPPGDRGRRPPSTSP